jgi:hypothetical protein
MANVAVRIIGDYQETRYPYRTKRGAIGTGFLVTVQSETVPEARYGYLATAAHVLDGAGKIEVQVPNMYNGSLSDPFEVTGWTVPKPEMDLAVAYTPPDVGRWAAGYPIERTVPAGELRGPTLGASIYYIGILTPLDRVMVRSGTIGALDQTGVSHIDSYDYTCHLVDCRSYGGFSGSPCFLETQYPGLTDTPLPKELQGIVPFEDGHESDDSPGSDRPYGRMGHYALMCGMFTEHITDHEPSTHSRMGVGIMMRSNEIRRALMTKDLRDERLKMDNEADEGPSIEGQGRGGSNFTKPDFDSALEKVTRPKPESNGPASC